MCRVTYPSRTAYAAVVKRREPAAHLRRLVTQVPANLAGARAVVAAAPVVQRPYRDTEVVRNVLHRPQPRLISIVFPSQAA